MEGVGYLFKQQVANARLKPSQIRKLKLKQAIINEIYNQSQTSIYHLSQTIKMSTPTITRAVEELIEEGMVRDIGIGESTGGRRPSLYGLNPSSRYVLGIDLERFYTRIAVFDFCNNVVNKIYEFNEGLDTNENILDFIVEKISEILAETGAEKRKVMGVGMSIPGLIDISTGISHTYLNTGRPVDQDLMERLGIPVFIDNDTRMMAWGEQAFGLAKGHPNVLCLNIGSGIGMSMILNGKIYSGQTGFSGEFGHIQVDPNGNLCHCGKIGCLETIASGKVMLRKAKEDLANGAITQISKIIDGNMAKLSIKTIMNAAHAGDQYAIDLLSKIGEALGKGIAILIHLFNPELIIVGGEMSQASNFLISPIESNLNIYTIARIRKSTQIIASDLGDNARIMGTVALTMSRIFK